MKSIEELQREALSNYSKAKRQKKVQQRQERQAKEKLAQRQNFAIGELVARYFPKLREITPGTRDENAERYSKLEECLRRLAESPEMISQLTTARITNENEPPDSNV